MTLELLYQHWLNEQQAARLRQKVLMAQLQTELLRAYSQRLQALIDGGKA